MGKIEKLLEETLELPRDERERLLAQLQESLEVKPSEDVGGQPTSYRALIDLAGTLSSAFSDVSTDKLKHLAEAYKPRPGEE